MAAAPLSTPRTDPAFARPARSEPTHAARAPEARRRFLDRGLVGTLPSYLGTLSEYGRVLKQKNALLREAAQADEPEKYVERLQPWNDQLVELGTEIPPASARLESKPGR